MGPKWPFVLMYESHDMRHRFSQVEDGQRDPPKIRASHRLLVTPMELFRWKETDILVS